MYTNVVLVIAQTSAFNENISQNINKTEHCPDVYVKCSVFSSGNTSGQVEQYGNSVFAKTSWWGCIYEFRIYILTYYQAMSHLIVLIGLALPVLNLLNGIYSFRRQMWCRQLGGLICTKSSSLFIIFKYYLGNSNLQLVLRVVVKVIYYSSPLWSLKYLILFKKICK